MLPEKIRSFFGGRPPETRQSRRLNADLTKKIENLFSQNHQPEGAVTIIQIFLIAQSQQQNERFKAAPMDLINAVVEQISKKVDWQKLASAQQAIDSIAKAAEQIQDPKLMPFAELLLN